MQSLIPVAAIALALSTAASSAAVIMTIDISNPAAVRVTAIANNAQVNGSITVNYNGGISLRDFFTAPSSIPYGNPVGISGNWKAAGAVASYAEMVTFVFESPDPVPGRDLSIYNRTAPESDEQTFTTTSSPFTGTSTFNFSSIGNLPAIGTIGDVNIGFMSTHGGVIGQWQVIPEPSVALVSSLGILTLFRRRR